jgi:hypothetical protein
MTDKEKKPPRAAFDDRFSTSPTRKKFRRPSLSDRPKPLRCSACGGEHRVRDCKMGA